MPRESPSDQLPTEGERTKRAQNGILNAFPYVRNTTRSHALPYLQYSLVLVSSPYGALKAPRARLSFGWLLSALFFAEYFVSRRVVSRRVVSVVF